MNQEIAEIYGKRVRIRVCGLCWDGDSILMVKHKMTDHYLWAPPGGGVEFGESLEKALKREFLEETGLEIMPEKFLFGCEFIKDPLHAIELFFQVKKVSGELARGSDPEAQIIEDVKYLSPEEILAVPKDSLHGIFTEFPNASVLRQLSGFYSI